MKGLFRFALIFITLAQVLCGCGQKGGNAGKAPVQVIFDTDIGNDIDDAIALSMLFNYDKAGVIDLNAITICKRNPHCVEYIDGVSRFFGRGDIPVGFAYDGTMPEDYTYLLPTINAEYEGRPLLDIRRTLDGSIPAGYKMLRQQLAAAADTSVVLIAVGPLTNIANLLTSAPDELSDLDGIGLVRQKVKLVSIMGGNFISEWAEYNIMCDIPAAQKVFSLCPSPLVAGGYEVGSAVHYPHSSILNDFGDPASNPICVGYMNYCPMPYDRECWDPLATLEAIEPGVDGILSRSEKGRITISDSGVSYFTPDPSGLQQYVILNDADKAVEMLVRRASGKE